MQINLRNPGDGQGHPVIVYLDGQRGSWAARAAQLQKQAMPRHGRGSVMWRRCKQPATRHPERSAGAILSSQENFHQRYCFALALLKVTTMQCLSLQMSRE